MISGPSNSTHWSMHKHGPTMYGCSLRWYLYAYPCMQVIKWNWEKLKFFTPCIAIIFESRPSSLSLYACMCEILEIESVIKKYWSSLYLIAVYLLWVNYIAHETGIFANRRIVLRIELIRSIGTIYIRVRYLGRHFQNQTQRETICANRVPCSSGKFLVIQHTQFKYFLRRAE